MFAEARGGRPHEALDIAALRRCDVIGYVGSTGNASAEAPHLHFAVFGLGLERRWWEGVAINPHPALVAGGGRACR